MNDQLRHGLLALLLCLAAACQLVDRPQDLVGSEDASSENAGPAADDLLGNPAERFPSTIAELLAFAAPEAFTWQPEPVLSDLTVWMDEQQRWERVRLGYVAAEADRILTLRASPPDQLSIERPRLEGIGLPILPAEAVASLEPLPEDVLEPAALGAASAGALAQCGSTDEPVRAVLYATGAPGEWDGEQWASVPAWRATVVTESTGVSVAPDSGTPYAPLLCVEPLLLDEPEEQAPSPTPTAAASKRRGR